MGTEKSFNDSLGTGASVRFLLVSGKDHRMILKSTGFITSYWCVNHAGLLDGLLDGLLGVAGIIMKIIMIHGS